MLRKNFAPINAPGGRRGISQKIQADPKRVASYDSNRVDAESSPRNDWKIRLPTVNALLPKELIQILVSPDALGVASGRESRIRYNSVDVIAGLAYQDREVECQFVFAKLGHGSRAIRVHCISARAGTPDQRNVAVYRDCGHLGQLTLAVERRFGNAIYQQGPVRRQNLTVNCKSVGSLDGRISTLPVTGGYR